MDAAGNPCPNSPLVVIDQGGGVREGIHVDMATVPFGTLWNCDTVAVVTWGNLAVDGRLFGTVQLKNGVRRTYWDSSLIEPYVKAWNLAKAQLG